MAYGDYQGPDKPNKGHEGGACNRQRCQAEPAIWYNHGSFSWYCSGCAKQIGQDPVNLRHWNARWRPECGHSQFETRYQIDMREGVKTVLAEIELRALALAAMDLQPKVEKMFKSIYPHAPTKRKPKSESLKRILAGRNKFR